MNKPTDSILQNKTAAAEGTLAYHTLKHHFSFQSTDCTTNLMSSLFNDSEIAKKITSCQTKTKAIAVNVIATYCRDKILEELEDVPFISISSDASNHGSDKLFPVLIQFFSQKNGTQT